jgi:hypothetical protein
MFLMLVHKCAIGYIVALNFFPLRLSLNFLSNKFNPIYLIDFLPVSIYISAPIPQLFADLRHFSVTVKQDIARPENACCHPVKNLLYK